MQMQCKHLAIPFLVFCLLVINVSATWIPYGISGTIHYTLDGITFNTGSLSGIGLVSDQAVISEGNYFGFDVKHCTILVDKIEFTDNAVGFFNFYIPDVDFNNIPPTALVFGNSFYIGNFQGEDTDRTFIWEDCNVGGVPKLLDSYTWGVDYRGTGVEGLNGTLTLTRLIPAVPEPSSSSLLLVGGILGCMVYVNNKRWLKNIG
jgi:hypothetical protein